MSAVRGSRDQVNRLLALVPYLQRRGEVSLAEAAQEFGVPVATMRRDVRVLPFCGLPGLGMGDLIELDFDALDGEKVIRLSNADYLTRPLRLDSTEAAALMVGLRALAEGASPEERDVVVRALGKIEAAVGEAGGLAAQVDLHPVESPEATSLRERLAGAVALADRLTDGLRDHEAGGVQRLDLLDLGDGVGDADPRLAGARRHVPRRVDGHVDAGGRLRPAAGGLGEERGEPVAVEEDERGAGHQEQHEAAARGDTEADPDAMVRPLHVAALIPKPGLLLLPCSAIAPRAKK